MVSGFAKAADLRKQSYVDARHQWLESVSAMLWIMLNAKSEYSSPRVRRMGKPWKLGCAATIRSPRVAAATLREPFARPGRMPAVASVLAEELAEAGVVALDHPWDQKQVDELANAE